MRQVADIVHTLEFCINGARCSHGDEAALIKLLTGKKDAQLDLIVLTVGTGSKQVTESKDATSLQLFGQQDRMLEIISVHAPAIPVVVFVYSAAPVNISVAVASPQVRNQLFRKKKRILSI